MNVKLHITILEKEDADNCRGGGQKPSLGELILSRSSVSATKVGSEERIRLDRVYDHAKRTGSMLYLLFASNEQTILL